jgi:hypothetical protein
MPDKRVRLRFRVVLGQRQPLQNAEQQLGLLLYLEAQKTTPHCCLVLPSGLVQLSQRQCTKILRLVAA